MSRTTETSWTRVSAVAAAAGTAVSAVTTSSAAGSILQTVVTGRSSRRGGWRNSDNRYERPPQPLW
ncbi:hypothetical protein [Amycolatopsis sp. NPDC049159]|uniref:hypothetical protein n=1 Tax=Amycolatopsis sp. NPDC049159 TaxID=3157210 RepID=UPI0033F918F6